MRLGDSKWRCSTLSIMLFKYQREKWLMSKNVILLFGCCISLLTASMMLLQGDQMATQTEFLKTVLKPEAAKYLATQSVPGLKVPVSPGMTSQGQSVSSPFIGFKGSYNVGSGSSQSSSPRSYSPSLYAAPGNVTGSSFNALSPASSGGGEQPVDAYTLSDAELFNLQLENAVMMKELGYGVSFLGDEMVYNRVDTLSGYGQYGYEANYPIYEQNYTPQSGQYWERYPSNSSTSYGGGNRGQGYNGYAGGYSRNYWPRYGYQSGYYSDYSQGYPYYNQRYNGYNRRNYRYSRGYNNYRDDRRWENGNGYYR